MMLVMAALPSSSKWYESYKSFHKDFDLHYVVVLQDRINKNAPWNGPEMAGIIERYITGTQILTENEEHSDAFIKAQMEAGLLRFRLATEKEVPRTWKRWHWEKLNLRHDIFCEKSSKKKLFFEKRKSCLLL